MRAITVREPKNISSLQELLDHLCDSLDGRERVSVATMVQAAGPRSFGPLLLLLGLIVFSPLSGVPGLPTLVALSVLLIAAQFLAGRRTFWLPRVVLRRRVSRSKFARAVGFLRPVARVADRLARPRLLGLTEGIAVHGIAALCLLIALTMPPLELVPFANSAAGAALSALGLALIAQDGLLAILAVACCATGIGLAAANFL